MPTLSCPDCGYTREIPADRLAPARLRLKCPSCSTSFVVDGAALLQQDEVLELDWGDRQPPAAAAPPPSEAEDFEQGLRPIGAGAPPYSQQPDSAAPPSGGATADLEPSLRPAVPGAGPGFPQAAAAPPQTSIASFEQTPRPVAPGANLDRFRMLGATASAPAPIRPSAVAAAPLQPGAVEPSGFTGSPPYEAPIGLAGHLTGDTARDFAEYPEFPADRLPTDDFRVNAAALPIALGIAVLAKLLWLPGALLDYFRVWLHEFGHALVAWLGSRAATPLALMPGVGWASINPQKSVLVFVCFLFLIAVLGYRSWRVGSRFLMGFAIVLAVLQVWFSLFTTPTEWELVQVWAGAGGELILSAGLIVAFYHRFPDRFRWDFVRFIVLVIAMYAFANALLLWVRAFGDHTLIPYGTGLFGAADQNGDMNRLRAFGWSPGRITRSYVMTGLVCGGSIVGYYLFFLRRALSLRAGRSPQQGTSAPGFRPEL